MARISSKSATDAANDFIFSFEQAHQIPANSITPVRVKVKEEPTTSAGLCFVDARTVSINWSIMKHMDESFFLEILAHEVAHHIDYQMSPNNETNHGKTWKKICKSIGAFPFQGHIYPIAQMLRDNANRFFDYRCEERVCWLDKEEHYKARGKIRSGDYIWNFDNQFEESIRIQEALDEARKNDLTDRIKKQPWKHKTFWRFYGHSK